MEAIAESFTYTSSSSCNHPIGISHGIPSSGLGKACCRSSLVQPHLHQLSLLAQESSDLYHTYSLPFTGTVRLPASPSLDPATCQPQLPKVKRLPARLHYPSSDRRPNRFFPRAGLHGFVTEHPHATVPHKPKRVLSGNPSQYLSPAGGN